MRGCRCVAPESHLDVQERRSNILTYRSYHADAVSAAIRLITVWRFGIDWVLHGWANLLRAFERSGSAKFIYIHRILRSSLAHVGFYLLEYDVGESGSYSYNPARGWSRAERTLRTEVLSELIFGPCMNARAAGVAL